MTDQRPMAFRMKGVGMTAQIELDGVDISGKVSSVEIVSQARKIPEVVLHLVSPARDGWEWEGDALVYLAVPPSPSVVADFADRLLASLDPKKVEAIALSELDMDSDQNMTRNIIEAIRSIINEAASPEAPANPE